MQNLISYIRVSTQKQGQSGLGLDAQSEAVNRYLIGKNSHLLAEFVEVESGRKTDKERPELARALEACKKQKAVLVVAKLDRLARNVHFISGLMEAKIKFIALDMPDANELSLHVMAAFAEHEAKRISERTKAALFEAKKRGTALGVEGINNLKPNLEQRKEKARRFAESLRTTLEGFQRMGLTQRQMAGKLNSLGIQTAKGGVWSLIQVQRILERLRYSV